MVDVLDCYGGFAYIRARMYKNDTDGGYNIIVSQNLQ